MYLELVENEELVFTDAYSEGWKPAPDPFMTAIILFKDTGDGKTKYTAIARHRSPEAREKHETMGFFDGWEPSSINWKPMPSHSETNGLTP